MKRTTVEPNTTTGCWQRIAARRGDAVAVATPDETISFAEAGTRSAERGRAIAAAVAEPGRPVAVETESDVDSALALLSVLCSGHPVIALDPFLPEERRAHILALSGARHLTPQQIRELPASDRPVAEPAPDDPAVVVFTSGSTGRPKGVVHGQRSWVNQARDGREVLGLGPDDRAAVLLPLSFGAGFDGLLMPLLNGAGLLLWDVRHRGTAGLREWLDAESATTAHCTPSLLRSWLADSDVAAVESLRLLTTCGEPVHASDVALLRSTLLPRGVFCSWSGSSEAGNLAFNPYPPERALPDGAIPVGAPSADKHVRILDEDGVDVPPGDAGEVVIESSHLALGYHDDPESTARRFVPLEDGRTALRTGDLGRFDAAGQLHLLGRRDDAVKIRGYLVEPLEVEAALRALPWTVDAVVTGDAAAGVLTAHVAVDRSRWSPSPAEIRTALGRTLAPWMVPSQVVVLDELPRTERGKVDRAALPPPPERAPEPVRGPTEAALKAVWCTVLGLDDVGRNEDFVELGGDSLAAATMLGELRDRWLVDISSAEFANDPTIAALGLLLDDAHRDRRSSATGSLTRLRPGDGTPLFLYAGAGSPAASLLPLVRALGGDEPVYGLQAHGLETRGRADRSVRAAARRAVRDLTAVAPHGPYRLAGYSFGAFVMLEAATLLRERAERVECVVLLDPRFETDAPVREALPDRGGVVPGDPGPPTEEPRQALAARLAVLWNRVAMRALVATAGLWRLPTTLQWTVFWDLGRVLLRKHRPTPYAGPVTLVRASDNDDDPARWAPIATGDLTVAEVPGDHHSMMRDPHVAATAARLRTALDGQRLDGRALDGTARDRDEDRR
ncbi:MAG: AMP-binding protein [Gordonia sp. (in: high G+C Gram-positive bacteria)]|uniref:AMP-binding protein n=1 Tax=Gordonia sp. (in: high G+C Gram-positive bacteria) TaxID=84139 RepID=UPI0039E3CDF7